MLSSPQIAPRHDGLTVTTSDGVGLAVNVAGRGDAIVFVHEFSGDLGSWAPQVSRLREHYRCIVFNARGYPPSQVPDLPSAYGQQRAADDIADVLDALGIASAHV